MPTTTPASTRPHGSPRPRRRRRRTLVVAVTLLVGVAAGCDPAPPDTTPPSWRLVDRAFSTPVGPHVELSWDAAQGTPSRYRIDVNGVTATLVEPLTTRCVMVGLAASTAYTFRITAYDAAGNWSDSLPPDGQHDPGFRPAAASTPAGPGGGPTLRCVPATDTDGDRLPDALETGTGTYAHAAATGTSPAVVDTDVDGLDDGDEVLGSLAGLDLRALGTRPTQPDLLLEVDWLTGFQNPACGTPNLTPQASWFVNAVAGFAQLDLPTSGGGTGVKLIVDRGQGGVFTGGNAIPHATGDAGVPPESAGDLMAAHLAANRVGYFHHSVVPVRISVGGALSTRPIASVGGAEFWLPLGCSAPTPSVMAEYVMHELGHNLGLRHGGTEATNYKPSYNSIMNYRYAQGLDLDCDDYSDPPPAGRLGFSSGTRPPIDENHVVEAHGVCGTVPYDLDGDGSIDAAPYAADLNADGRLEVLRDNDDLGSLDLTSFTDDDRMGDPVEWIVEDGP